MKYNIKQARNKEYTLSVNDISIYSHYDPKRNAQNWIKNEIDLSKEGYFLIGLGLGYHLEAIIEYINKDKKIIVYYFDEEEYQIFQKYGLIQCKEKNNVILTNSLRGIKINDNIQVLIPDVWVRAIGQEHPLFPILDVMKNTQRSYKRNKELLLNNFYLNCQLGDSISYPKPVNKIACLVAAGPSLSKTVNWLKNIENYVDIYVCGAALKVVEKQNINPAAVFITDANDTMKKQLQCTNYSGALFYLSTANHAAIKLHNGKRYMLLQEGYRAAEQYAKVKNVPLIETGGSVSTTIFSYLENQNYQTIILFGQDMGFRGEFTHALDVITRKKIYSKEKLRRILSNNGNYIYTTPTLYAFLYWFNEKLKHSKISVYNTAKHGAKLINVPYINENKLMEIVKERGY